MSACLPLQESPYPTNITFRHRIHSNTTYSIPINSTSTEFIHHIKQFPQSLEVIPADPSHQRKYKPYFDYDYIITHHSIDYTQTIIDHLSNCLSIIDKIFPESVPYALNSSRPTPDGYKISFHFIIDDDTLVDPMFVKRICINHNAPFDLSVYKSGEAYFRTPYCSKDLDGQPLKLIKLDHLQKLTEYSIDELPMNYQDLLITHTRSFNLTSNLPTVQSSSEHVQSSVVFNNIQSRSEYKSQVQEPTIDYVSSLSGIGNSPDPDFRNHCITKFLESHPLATIRATNVNDQSELVTFNGTSSNDCLICHRQHTSNNNYIYVNHDTKTCVYKCFSANTDYYPNKSPHIMLVDRERILPMEGAYFEDILQIHRSQSTINQVKSFLLGCVAHVKDSTSGEIHYAVRSRQGWIKKSVDDPLQATTYNKYFVKVGDKKLTYGKILLKLIQEPEWQSNIYSSYGFYPLAPSESKFTHLNTFNGFPLQQTTVDQNNLLTPAVNTIITHIHSLTGEEQHLTDYVIHWLANILQQPRAKQNIIVIISKPGAGKNVFYDIISKVIGYTKLINGTSALLGRFNQATVDNKLLIVINEAKNEMTEDQWQTFKSMITDIEQDTERKFEERATTHVYAKFMMFSNNPRCVRYEAYDRRIVTMMASDRNINRANTTANKSYFDRLHQIASSPSELAEFCTYLLSIKIPDDFLQQRPMGKHAIDTAISQLSNFADFIKEFTLTINPVTPEYFMFEDIQQAYLDYCNRMRITQRLNARSLSHELKQQFGIENKTYRIGGERVKRFKFDYHQIDTILMAMIGTNISVLTEPE